MNTSYPISIFTLNYSMNLCPLTNILVVNMLMNASFISFNIIIKIISIKIFNLIIILLHKVISVMFDSMYKYHTCNLIQ